MTRAPVVLFVYKRPLHARRTIEALLRNTEAARTPLYVFSDAPRSKDVAEAVAEVRSIVRDIRGFASLSVVEREMNLGLSGSIVDGVSHVCEKHGQAIVVEDDLVTSPYFLRYMNEALDKYRHDERVISIHGYVYPVEGGLPDTFFLNGTDCWGWATWKRGWDLFDPDGQKLLDELERRKLGREFDFDGSYPYCAMLEDQIAGRNDSWAIRWYASAFLRNKLTLYPGRSLVENIGVDDSGTHCSDVDHYTGGLARTPIPVDSIAVEESAMARRMFAEFHRRTRPSLPRRVVNRVLGKFRETMGRHAKSS